MSADRIAPPRAPSPHHTNCRTAKEVVATITELFSGESVRISKFTVEAITADGNRLKYSFDRKDVK